MYDSQRNCPGFGLSGQSSIGRHIACGCMWEKAMAEERAHIIAFLRGHSTLNLGTVADALERGDHRGGEES